jgi:hypothetical protein
MNMLNNIIILSGITVSSNLLREYGLEYIAVRGKDVICILKAGEISRVNIIKGTEKINNSRITCEILENNKNISI